MLTLTGTATVANYQTALRSVTYRNTTDDNPTTPKTVEFKVNDGDVDSSAGARRTSTSRPSTTPRSLTTTGAALALHRGQGPRRSTPA